MSVGNLRILIVDDDEDDRVLAEELLRTGLKGSAGVEIDTVASSKDAWERLHSAPYDAVVCDYRLGAEDGLSFLREIRTQGVHTAFVLLTGQGQEEVAVEAIQAGASNYLVKARVTASALASAVVQGVRYQKEHALRKHAEFALRSSEERFRALVEHSSEFIAMLAKDGTILYVSQSACSALGYGGRELLGRRASALVHPDDLADLSAAGKRCLAEPGNPVATKSRVVDGEGAVRRVTGTAVNRLTDPSVAAIVVHCREEAATADAGREQFFTGSPALFCIIGPDGVVRDVNSAWEQALGMEPTSLVGRPIAELVHRDDRDWVTSADNVIGRDVRFLVDDGGFRTIKWSSARGNEDFTYAVAQPDEPS